MKIVRMMIMVMVMMKRSSGEMARGGIDIQCNMQSVSQSIDINRLHSSAHLAIITTLDLH